MCVTKGKLLFFSLFLAVLLSPAFTSGPDSLPLSPDFSPLPVFPIIGNVTTIPKPTPTDKPLTLNERTARQLEAWIEYYEEVKSYAATVETWSKQVADSWEKVKASSTNYEQAIKLQIKTRDDEIKHLKGDVIKYTAFGAVGGFITGLIVGLLQ